MQPNRIGLREPIDKKNNNPNTMFTITNPLARLLIILSLALTAFVGVFSMPSESHSAFAWLLIFATSKGIGIYAALQFAKCYKAWIDTPENQD